MNFGEDFKKCRKYAGLSQKDVAIKLGIHQSSVSDWENNVSQPDLGTVIELCKLYGVSLYDLLGVDEYTFRKN